MKRAVKMTSDNNQAENSRYRLYFRQILTALAPLLGVVVSGLTSGYSAVLLPQLKSVGALNGTDQVLTDEIRVTTIEEESWIASAAVLPMAPGCWLSGLVMEKLGRRKSVMVTFPIFTIAWLLIAFATNITYLIAGRLLSGLCVGLLGPLVPVYISEISDPLLRGILLGGISLALCIGILGIHIIGTWVHWRTTAYICVVVPCVCWVICIFSRESPTWLVNKGLFREAKQAWIYFRGEGSFDEYLLLENSKPSESKNAKDKSTLVSYLKDTLTTRFFLIPLGVLSLFFFTAQFAGTNVVVFYSVDMLADVAGRENAYLGSLVVDVVRTVFSGIACVLVKKFRRRSLTFLSGFGTAFTLLALSSSLYWEIGKPWLPALLLMIYTALLTVGLIPLPWMLCGELFPRQYRGLGSGFTSGFTFICFFVVVKVAPAMFAAVQPYGTFAIYGIITLIGTGLLALTLPETKDKTLQEIERSFAKKPSKLEEHVNSFETISLSKPV